jgi:hypothetical protein
MTIAHPISPLLIDRIKHLVEIRSIAFRCIHNLAFSSRVVPFTRVNPEYVTHTVDGTAHITCNEFFRNVPVEIPLVHASHRINPLSSDFVHPVADAISTGIDTIFFNMLDLASVRVPWYRRVIGYRLTRQLLTQGLLQLYKHRTPCKIILLPEQHSSSGISTLREFRKDYPQIRIYEVPSISRVYFLPASFLLGSIYANRLCYLPDASTFDELHTEFGMVLNTVNAVYSYSI